MWVCQNVRVSKESGGPVKQLATQTFCRFPAFMMTLPLIITHSKSTLMYLW